ncbi:hypothetical protein ABVB70_26615, partial [Agrobacterium radiobacter]
SHRATWRIQNRRGSNRHWMKVQWQVTTDQNRKDAAPTWSPDVERVHRVLLKTAVGHALFERGELVPMLL